MRGLNERSQSARAPSPPIPSSIASDGSGRQVRGMANAFLTSRRCIVRLIAWTTLGLTLMGSVPLDALEAERGAITQAVLNDASVRWRGPRPCISDDLRSFSGKGAEPKRISQLPNVKSPFAICRSSSLSAMQGDRFLSLSAPKFFNDSASVELDYSCPTCGNGTLYALRKIKGGWRVVRRQASWVS